MTQERDSLPPSSKGVSTPHDLKPRMAPQLPRFRRLQMLAVTVACVWLMAGVLTGRYLIEQELKHNLKSQQALLNSETTFLVRTFEQNLHQAEQLSRTLSFDRSLIALAQQGINRNAYLSAFEKAERVEHLLAADNVQQVNDLFHSLAGHVDAYQLYMFDYWGYCVASSHTGTAEDCIGSRYNTRAYFQNAALKGYSRQFAVGRLHPVPSFFFSTALTLDNQFVGAVVVRLLTEDAVNFIHPSQPLTLVTAKDGVIIASSNTELVFQHVGEPLVSLPALADYRRIYKQNEMTVLPLSKYSGGTGGGADGKTVWLWQGKRYLIGAGVVAQEDYRIYLFREVEAAFLDERRQWGFAITLLIAGLLIILLVERSANFHLSRRAHLQALSEANRHLTQVSQDLYELTITDSLTGISSRRYFTQRLQEEVEREIRRSHDMPRSAENFSSLSLLLLDIDRFKKVNDTYGHPAGDEAIRTMARICSDCVRPSDVVGRMGGEEFGILLCDVTPQQTKQVAQRILAVCQETLIKYEQHSFKQTCSIGIARLQKGQNTDQLLSSVDKALYAAKNAGRNRYVYG